LTAATVQALQRRIDSLNSLVTAPFEPSVAKAEGKSKAQMAKVAELKLEHENMLAPLIAQLEEQEADLVGSLPSIFACTVLYVGHVPALHMCRSYISCSIEKTSRF
jgi:hypothetical protein